MRKIIGIIILCGMTANLTAQTRTDIELWTGGTYRLRLTKHLWVHIEQQFRFNDTISNYSSSYSEIGLRYRMKKHFSFQGNYRHIVIPDIENNNRYSVDAFYNWNRDKFPLSLEYRLRFQDTKDNNTERKFTYIRNMVTIDYDLTQLVDPLVAFEIFFRYNEINEFSRWRLLGGLDWHITSQLQLTTFYRYQKEIDEINPIADHIFGLMITYGSKERLKTLRNRT